MQCVVLSSSGAQFRIRCAKGALPAATMNFATHVASELSPHGTSARWGHQHCLVQKETINDDKPAPHQQHYPSLGLNSSSAASAVPKNMIRKPPIYRQIHQQLAPTARTLTHLDVLRLERLALALRAVRPRPARGYLAGGGYDALPGHRRVCQRREELERCRVGQCACARCTEASSQYGMASRQY